MSENEEIKAYKKKADGMTYSDYRCMKCGTVNKEESIICSKCGGAKFFRSDQR